MLEPVKSRPLDKGKCDWCGASCTNTYCSADCRVKYNNLLASQGKTVMQMLKIWRKHRGRKGTPAEGMIGEIATRVDELLQIDRARKKDLQNGED